MSISIEYAYDKNGNLTRDDNKGMTFTYDLLGHPLAIAGSDNQTDYVYSADGRKLSATHTQGDNRTLIGSNGQRDQYSHYYPYGGLMGDISTNDAHSYKYGGKELDRDFGIDLFDFEARQYDAKLPAFTSIDPLAENTPGISPYAYCAGDPVNLVDPTGMFPIYDWDTGEYYDSDTGKKVSWGQVQNYISTGNYEEQRKETEKNVSPWQLGVEWLTGTGPRKRVFGNDDLMSKMLSEHEHIRTTVTDSILYGIKVGKYKSEFGYELEGWEGVPKYIKDYSTLLTGGLTGNLAVTYLGSYRGNWSVLKVDETSAQVLFEVTNSSTFASGTRPPVIGYTPSWRENVAPKLNRRFLTGPMSETQQRIVWTKTIKLK